MLLLSNAATATNFLWMRAALSCCCCANNTTWKSTICRVCIECHSRACGSQPLCKYNRMCRVCVCWYAHAKPHAQFIYLEENWFWRLRPLTGKKWCTRRWVQCIANANIIYNIHQFKLNWCCRLSVHAAHTQKKTEQKTRLNTNLLLPCSSYPMKRKQLAAAEREKKNSVSD